MRFVGGEEEEIPQLTEAFSVFDVDGDGIITSKDVFDVLQKMGQNPTEAELEEMFKEGGADENGSMDFSAFKSMMINNMSSMYWKITDSCMQAHSIPIL